MSGHSSETNVILNSVSDGITINSQGVFVYVNETFAKMVGYNVHELIGMSVFSLVAPDYRELVKDRTLTRQQGLDVVSVYELELVRKDGVRFPVEFSVSRIDYMGKSSSLTIIRDISERKQIVGELRTEKNRLQLLSEGLSNTGIGVDIVDLNHTVLSQNQLLMDRFGDCVGEKCYKVYLEFDAPCDFCPMEDAIKSGSVESVELRGADGRYYEISAAPLVNLDGVIASVIEVVRDITERRQVEDALRESEALFRGFMESATEGFVLFDSDLNFVDINEIGVKRMGMTKEEVVGKHILEIMKNLTNSERYEKYIEVLETGKSQIFEIDYNYSGLQKVRINIFKVGDGLGMIATDLTALVKEQSERSRLFEELTSERVHREYEQELSRLKTQFMSTATHEIRTPLTAILGYIELIDEATKIPDVKSVTQYYQGMCLALVPFLGQGFG